MAEMDRATINRRLNTTWDMLEDVLIDVHVPDGEIEQHERALRRSVCLSMDEHDFINDHCGKPEHRYCSTCHARPADSDSTADTEGRQ